MAQDDISATGTWRPWQPDEVMERLAGVGAHWCVVGGWAIDLWHGKETRPHADLEIAILRSDFPLFRAALKRFSFFIAANGTISLLAPGLLPEPQHHQLWVLDETAMSWRMGIFLEPGDVSTWVYRRNEQIRCPRSAMIATTSKGIPYLKPEGVLLYKAKVTREKDESDFQTCAPLMEIGARAWLRNALSDLHPSHRWIEELRCDWQLDPSR
jgi:hypothetical protein